MSSKFSRGDLVRVTDIENNRYDQTLTVSGIWSSGLKWVYNFIVDGHAFSMREHHLTLADPDVHTVLDQMDAESANEPTKPRKGVTSEEIFGVYVRGLIPAAPFDNAPLNTRAKTLRTAEDLVNGQRARDYGDPQENFGRIASLWNAQFSKKLKEPFTAGDVALALVHLKLSRLANTPDHEDSFVDACGYLALGAEIAEGL